MPDQSINWLRSYQQLPLLSQALAQADTPETLQRVIQQARELHSQLQQSSEINLAAAMAQLSYIPSEEPATVNRTIKSWVLLMLWTRLKHWPKARRDLLGVAVLLAGCTTVHNKIPAALQLAKKLKEHKIGGIITTVLAGTFHRLQKRLPWQVHHDSPLLTLAIELGYQLQPEKGSAPALEVLLARWIIGSNDELVLTEISQLIHYAPALYLCGRVASDEQDNFWLLCHADNHSEGYQALQYWPEHQRLAEHPTKRNLDELNILPPAKLIQQHWLAKVSMPKRPEVPILNPNDLMQQSILGSLSHSDLNAQVSLLEKHPAIAQLLLENATASNRQKVAVNNLRHALASFGQAQLPLAVARAELQFYLQCQRSNQHAWLWQLQQALYHSLFLLGQHLAQPLSQQQAGLIACCASTPLWHHPSLQAVPVSRLVQHQHLLGQLVQKYLLEPVKSQRLTAALLHHYQLENWAEGAMCQYTQHIEGMPWTLAEQQGLLLRLAWQLTFSVFCYPTAQQSTQHLLQQATTTLSLPLKSLKEWQQLLLQYDGLFYPLNSEFA
ncbi:hypothetical protein [Alishewanella sp. SMS8]|uniref:hypothetical protein n=1 Tax=Alishewanella sp. SMS8 TaxID=2994676 RepID=UPI0027419E2A|nr:hypothetical protein [Alishewanella sp. SMS8]MDP5458458.1 hypothetical protein [Alishewanella sp. SMS8]